MPLKQREVLGYLGQVEEAMVKGFPFQVPKDYADRPLLLVRLVTEEIFFCLCFLPVPPVLQHTGRPLLLLRLLEDHIALVSDRCYVSAQPAVLARRLCRPLCWLTCLWKLPPAGANLCTT